MNILIVGKSFIGNALYNYNKSFNYKVISHNDITGIDYSKFNIVINTAISPLYRNNSYSIDYDIDVKIANMACSAGCYYIMISSRKVYGNFKQLKTLTEMDPYNPFDYYSENKSITEQYLITNFRENVCIIRGSNFFGFELNRESFFGFCLTNLLKYSKIDCSINENIIRDFIEISDVVFLLDKIFKYKPVGIFNLGLNKGFSVKTIADNLILGFTEGIFNGREDLEFDQQFILDTTKLYNSIKFTPNYINYEDTFINLGKQLKLYKGNLC